MQTASPEALHVVRTAFPDLKCRSVEIEPHENVTFGGTLWDGGNKREYAIVTPVTGHVTRIPDAPFLKRSPLHETSHPLIPGVVVVVRVYAGLREYARLYFHPKDAERFTPSAETEVSRDEKIVLYATRSLKSSYARIKDYRFHEAQRDTGITRERWDSAKEALIGKKLLNKRGAITVDGRNAVDGIYSFRAFREDEE